MWHALRTRWRNWRAQYEVVFLSERWVRDYYRQSWKQEYDGPHWRWPVKDGRVVAEIGVRDWEKRNKIL